MRRYCRAAPPGVIRPARPSPPRSPRPSPILPMCLRQSISWHDSPKRTPTALTGLLTSDLATVGTAIAQHAPALPQAVVTLAASYAVALSSGWKMTLVVVCGVPVLLASMAVQGMLAGRAAEKAWVAVL